MNVFRRQISVGNKVYYNEGSIYMQASQYTVLTTITLYMAYSSNSNMYMLSINGKSGCLL